MSKVQTLPNMKAVVVEHDELKLAGIPCISLKNMPNKYQNAKEGLLSSTKNWTHVLNPEVHYGMWPRVKTQDDPNTHAYILCVEVSTFEPIPEWYVKITIPPQRCVVAANKDGDFDAAGKVIDQYVKENGLTVSAGDRKYVICDRYNYDGEGFARYSLPIIQ